MQTVGFHFEDDAPDEKPHKVEILGAGQQFVGYGIHPETGNEYRWNGAGDPLTVPIDALPRLSEAQARRFIVAAEERLRIAGGRPCGKLRALDDQRAPEPNEKLVAHDANECLDAIAVIPNDDVSWDDWVYLGLAIKGALGENGRDAFDVWSAKSPQKPARCDGKSVAIV